MHIADDSFGEVWLHTFGLFMGWGGADFVADEQRDKPLSKPWLWASIDDWFRPAETVDTMATLWAARCAGILRRA